MKKEFQFNYGKKQLSVLIDTETTESNLIEPLSIRAVSDQKRTVEESLNLPMEFSIEKIRRAQSVAIAVNDNTRPVPHEILLPPLIDFLNKNGFQSSDIRFIIATGTHTPMDKENFRKILPENLVKKFLVISHNCDDKSILEYNGYTQYKTPVFVNSNFSSADLKIVVGNVEPHHFMGFSGGAKSASIGLAGRNTINANHSLLTHPMARIGEYENNPMRQDVEEIGDLIKIDFALNVVLNQDKQIVASFAGHPRAVMQAAIPVCREICQVKVSRFFDIVIASPGGSPKDINLYQSQKALTNASLVVKKGGIIILVAECPEGSGSQSFEQFMTGIRTCDAVFEKFNKLGFSVGPHKAFQIAKIAEKAKILMVSEMDPGKVSQFLISPFFSLEEAYRYALSISPSNPAVAMMPRAINTIPLISQ